MRERFDACIINVTTNKIFHGWTHTMIISEYRSELSDNNCLIFLVRYVNKDNEYEYDIACIWNSADIEYDENLVDYVRSLGVNLKYN